MQHTVNVERTVSQKRDRRDTKEVVTNKRKEYYPDGTLKSEIEESKETTDQGESVSSETKELRSQVLQLKKEHTVYQLKVEQTFKDRVNRAVASELTGRLKAEEAQNARRVEDTMARQVLADNELWLQRNERVWREKVETVNLQVGIFRLESSGCDH